MTKEPKFKNYKDKQRYYEELNEKVKVVHVSTELIKNRKGQVVGRTPGVTYRKETETNGK